ncbi:MAG TPA: Yip1 family protein [Rhodanobacteraceae bacterium]|nr:Yip1 family protein [Rhodanobacteraceae bacterium]
MDFSKLFARVKGILTAPRTEWPLIAAEPATVADLYRNYIVWLAAIPAVFGFIKGSLIGYGGFGLHVHVPIGAGIVRMIVTYLLTLVLAYVMALIVDALAPSFGGQKSPIQALKTIAYAWTASWVAGIGLIIPWLGWLIAIAGAIYSIYLLYLGLPATMKCPAEKTAVYTLVSIVIAIVLSWILMAVVAGVGAGAYGGFGASQLGSRSGAVTIDQDSALGKLAALGQKMEAAGQQMDAAQKSGDADAQAEAAGRMFGTLMGGGDRVEALAPALLKPFVPETLAGLKRTGISAERNGAMGVQISEAHGIYSDGAGRNLRLEITDMGGAKGIMALAGWAGIESDKETDHGYEKTYRQDGRLINERWDSRSRHGEYGIVLADRFAVKASGDAGSIDEIKAAVAGLDLAGLEALRNQGVKKG